MNKFITKIVAALALVFAALPALAWDGNPVGTIISIDATSTGAGMQGFRVYFTSGISHCAGGGTYSYIDETDSNYKVYVMLLAMAKIAQSQVILYTTTIGGACHIGYMKVN